MVEKMQLIRTKQAATLPFRFFVCLCVGIFKEKVSI